MPAMLLTLIRKGEKSAYFTARFMQLTGVRFKGVVGCRFSGDNCEKPPPAPRSAADEAAVSNVELGLYATFGVLGLSLVVGLLVTRYRAYLESIKPVTQPYSCFFLSLLPFEIDYVQLLNVTFGMLGSFDASDNQKMQRQKFECCCRVTHPYGYALTLAPTPLPTLTHTYPSCNRRPIDFEAEFQRRLATGELSGDTHDPTKMPTEINRDALTILGLWTVF
jgi:hypothetical protein